jgi:two-component system chemotaxis sensor kinase CheA
MADDPVIQTFLIECGELLQAMEDALLQLENAPDDEETINALFRSAHTIKGSSGIVGFENIERFTHKAENVLEHVRSGKITVGNELIELLLKCRDHIAALVEFAAADGPASEAARANEAGLLKQLQAYLEPLDNQSESKINGTTSPSLGGNFPNSLCYPHPSPLSTDEREEVRELFQGKPVETGNWHISLRFGQDVLRNGMDPISFINYLSRLGEIVSITAITDAIPPAEEMDPESCYLGFEIDFRSDFDKQTIEDVFEFVREDCKICILPPHSRIEEYVRLINDLPESPLNLGDILMKGGALTKLELEEALQIQNTETASCDGKQGETRRRIGEIVIDEKMVRPPVVDAALEKQKEQREIKSREARTIRVDTGKLDQLLNLVGELVIANANMNQHAQRIGDINLHESASALSRLVEDIRERAMQVRMLPIGEVFGRFQRVVRDISRDANKNIELIISGGETELDKNLVEKINDPLMHLVRNSADHGIEDPEVRRAKGKPEKGVIRLNAFQDTGCIVIEVADDGRGLDRDRILQKAVERGIVSAGQTLTDKEIYKLIFGAGFSTAEKVTNVSGRGVGMDVVRRNIDALRGTVDVESREGEGTTVSIRLPLTLAIIDGFMVGVGASSYIIPLDMVEECIELSEEERQVTYKRNYVNLRGEVMPYLRLRNLFNENGKKPLYEHIVVVKSAGHKIGLVVDGLHGEVQAVIKSLGKVYKDVNGVSGATILGDGTVALILDIPSLVKTVEMEEAMKSVN